MLSTTKNLLCLVGLPAALAAQAPPTIRLDKPAATHPAEWTDVVAVVEVLGGKLIVLDARDRQVKLADLTTGAVSLIGRHGSGPGEYQLPMHLFAIPGDSAILHDEANSGRPLVITGDGRISSYSITNRLTPFVTSTTVADWTGRFYRAGNGYTDLGADGAGGPGIERLDRRSSRLDTVAYVSRKRNVCGFSADPPGNARKPESFARAAARQVVNPYLQLEQWAVGPDGRVAIVCPSPYRVVIIDSSGKRTEGGVIAFDRVPVTEKEKTEWRESRRQPVATMQVNADGKMVTSYTRPPPPAEPDEWPDVLPPFEPVRQLNGAAMFAPDGLLWIRRLVGAGAPSLYDIVGKNGSLSYRVAFPPRTRVVGFGRRGIYAVTLDADDVQRLSRFAFPPMNNR